MIGRIDPQDKRITVVGAGIAGLLLAHFLDRAGYVVTLREAEPRAGGLIQTRRTPFGISEAAAHSLLGSTPVRALFEELQVPFVSTLESKPARWILGAQGGLRKVPAQAIGILGWVELILRVLGVPARGSYESLEDWGHRHLGKPATRGMLAPFVRGIYGAELKELDVALAFPAILPRPGRSLLWHLLTRPRVRGKKPMIAPRDGMGALTSALELSLASRLGDRFVRGEPLEKLPDDGQVALCVPAQEASRLLRDREPELSQALAQVPYVPLVSVTSFLSAASLDRTPQGVGYLSDRQGHPVLGTLFNSSSFPGRALSNRVVSVTTMIGGSARPDTLRLQDSEIEALVLEDLRSCLGQRTRIDHRVIHRWSRAIPIYGQDLARAHRLARQSWCAKPGRILFGNYTGQVSIRGMIEQLSESVSPDTFGNASSRP